MNVSNNNYYALVSSFLDGRTGPQCMHRYKSVDPQIKRGKWEEEEDDVSLCKDIFWIHTLLDHTAYF